MHSSLTGNSKEPGALHGQLEEALLTNVVNEFLGAKFVNCSGAQVGKFAN
jgi:hypothetical protein